MTDQQPAGMNLGFAIQELECGHRVARAAWNGNGMWLAIPGEDLPVDWQGNAQFIALYISPGAFSAWNPAQVDLLAKDWQVV